MRNRFFEQGGGSGTAGGESAGQPTLTRTADADAPKTIEELQQQVADLSAKHDKALAEKTGYEETKRKLAEANQMLAQVYAEKTTQPSTSGRSGGPFAQIDADIQRLEAIRIKAPGDPVTERDLRRAYEEREAIQWELTKRQAAQVIEQVTPPELQQLAWQFFSSGAFGTAEAAILAARGQLAQQYEKSKADEAARTKAASKPATGTPDAGPTVTTPNKPMSGSEYVKILHDKQGTPDAQKLIEQYDAGKFAVDWSR